MPVRWTSGAKDGVLTLLIAMSCIAADTAHRHSMKPELEAQRIQKLLTRIGYLASQAGKAVCFSYAPVESESSRKPPHDL